MEPFVWRWRLFKNYTKCQLRDGDNYTRGESFTPGDVGSALRQTAANSGSLSHISLSTHGLSSATLIGYICGGSTLQHS